MADIQTKYGTSGQTITATIALLSNNQARASTFIDNASNLFLDALVFFKARTAATLVSATGFIEVYGYGTVDSGTTYPEGITGTDGLVVLSNPPNVRLIGAFTANIINTTFTSGPFSVATAFGGLLPQRWGVVVRNLTGTQLQSGSDFAITYQGVFGQST